MTQFNIHTQSIYPTNYNIANCNNFIERACMNPRQKIATQTKFLVSMNALPEVYLQKLHPSQVSRYKNHFDVKEFLGYELNHASDQLLNDIRHFNQSLFDQKVIRAYRRLSVSVRNIFIGTKDFHKVLLHSKDEIVEVVQRVKELIPVKECARLLGVGESTLRVWIAEVRVRCSDSLINLCRKVHPNQLLPVETDNMKKLLMSEQFKYWPLISVYYYARNNNIVNMALSTWYKYAGLLNIKRVKPISIKHYGSSIVATQPNEYWHADVTQFRTADGLLHYIYLVVDNYSKMILSWAIDIKLSAEIRTQTFRDAVATAMQYHPNIETINLIVDGGSENNNKTVEQFIASIETIAIKKLRALKDVCYSNSMAEATNRILKTYYLNHQEIFYTQQLQCRMEITNNDFNTQRPHGRLNGLTPLAAYTCDKVDTVLLTKQMAEARKNRTYLNKNYQCGTCKF